MLFCALLLFSCAATSQQVPFPAETTDRMAVIPAGWFIMGTDFGEPNENPPHEIFIDTFKIDRHEVTAAEFAAFLNEKGNKDNRYFTHNEYSTVIGISLQEGRESETVKAPERYVPRKGLEDFPANNTSWYAGYDYCKWKGKRLPTEAEWEKAAKGTDFRIYPWGNIPPDPSKAVYANDWKEKGFSVMTPVDALKAGGSPYGVLNMSGNVLEWVADWYRSNYCNFCDPAGEDFNETASEIIGISDPSPSYEFINPDIPPKYDSIGPLVGSFKVLRGGGWSDSSAWTIRNSHRQWLAPYERYNNTGFRCAD